MILAIVPSFTIADDTDIGSAPATQGTPDQAIAQEIKEDTGRTVIINGGDHPSYDSTANALTLGTGDNQVTIYFDELPPGSIVITGTQVSINGQLITGANTISGNGNAIVVSDAGTIVATSQSEIIADSVDTFQAGPVVISNGENVHYINGCVTASSAGSLVHTDTVATSLTDVDFCSNTLDVNSADSIWAGCVYMEGVENTTVTTGTKVTINSDAGANFSIKDCASNQMNFSAFGNSSLSITRETLEPSYNLTNGIITLEHDGYAESLQSNTSTQAEIHRVNGIDKVTMNPVTIYTYDAKDPLKDFAIRAWQSSHVLYLRKSPVQQLPGEAATCKDCTVVDLPNHRAEIKGVIDFNKNQITRSGTNVNGAPVAFFTTGNADAHAQLTFDNDNAFVNELIILNNAPPYKTYISNYLAIAEAIQINGKTERLLSINEKVTKADISTSLLKSYKTVYNNATLKVDANVLTYARAGTSVTVLPDGNMQIGDIVDKLKAKRSLLLLPLLGLLMLFPRRRGQLSLFLLIGVVMLIIIGLLLYTVGIVSIPGQRIHVTERQQVQDYVTQCLAMSGKSALDVFGVQGGYITLPQGSFSAPPTAYLYANGKSAFLSLSQAELDIAQETKHRFLTCVDNFKGLSGVTVQIQRDPEVTATLSAKDTSFTMSYPFQVFKQDVRWDFDDFSATVDVPALTDYLAANVTVQSQIQNDDQINLDALPATKITFFPLQQTLLAFIESVGKQLDPYYFYFANER